MKCGFDSCLKSITTNNTWVCFADFVNETIHPDIVFSGSVQSMKHVGLFHNQVLLLYISGMRLGDTSLLYRVNAIHAVG